MVSFKAALLATAGFASTFAAPAELQERQSPGLNYNQNWGDGMKFSTSLWHLLTSLGTAKFNYKSGPGNSFSVTWSGDKGNFVVGRGWSTGTAR